MSGAAIVGMLCEAVSVPTVPIACPVPDTQ